MFKKDLAEWRKCNEGKWKIPCSGLALGKELALNTLKKFHVIADPGDQCLPPPGTPRVTPGSWDAW